MSNYFLLQDYLEVQLISMDASEGTDMSIAPGKLSSSSDCLSEPIGKYVNVLLYKITKCRIQDICLCPIILGSYRSTICLYQLQCCLPVVPFLIYISFCISPSIALVWIWYFSYYLKPRKLVF